MVAKNQLLYFADVCAGPGGFTEYVLWREGWNAKGFGFTLTASMTTATFTNQGTFRISEIMFCATQMVWVSTS
jgi:FtsJ-like methyltransferase